MWLILLPFISSITISYSKFNNEYFDDKNYKIELEEKPKEDSLYDNISTIYNKNRQKFECSSSNIVHSLEKKEQLDISIKIKELDGECSTFSKGWWTYELCLNRHIYQYHLIDGKLSGDKILLGKFAANSSINKTIEQINFYEQAYLSGDLCQTNGLPREVIVKLFCGNKKLSIQNVVENMPCVYEVHVQTRVLCDFDGFHDSSIDLNKIPIKCYPVLSTEDWFIYDAKIRKLPANKNSNLLNNPQEFNKIFTIIKNSLDIADKTDYDKKANDEPSVLTTGKFDAKPTKVSAKAILVSDGSGKSRISINLNDPSFNDRIFEAVNSVLDINMNGDLKFREKENFNNYNKIYKSEHDSLVYDSTPSSESSTLPEDVFRIVNLKEYSENTFLEEDLVTDYEDEQDRTNLNPNHEL